MKNPWFKFSPQEWLSGNIQFCSLEEKGLFIDICAIYWDRLDVVSIDNKFKVRYKDVEGTLSDLIGTLSDLGLITNSEAGITVPFLDRQIQQRKDFLKKCSDAGKKSASIQGRSSIKEIRNKKEEIRKKNKKSMSEQEFERFWSAYEKKIGKVKARQRFNRLTATDRQLVMDHVPKYVAATPDKQFRKDPAAYLNQQIWLDEELPNAGQSGFKKYDPDDISWVEEVKKLPY